MIRKLIPIFVCGVALAACQRADTGETASTPAAEPAPPMAAHLWQVDVPGRDQQRGSVLICADEAMRAGFSRPVPEINGQACPLKGEAVDRANGYSARCELDGRIYKVDANVQGDSQSDFTVDIWVQPEGADDVQYKQERHYRRVGECPAGWRLGDSRPLPVPAT